MWEPLFLINALALGIALVVNVCFLVYLLMRPRHKTGTLAILFSSFCTTVFILMASIELILPIPIISYGAAFLAVFVVMSYLLVALLVPNRQFSKLHVVLLAVAVLMGMSNSYLDRTHSFLIYTLQVSSQLRFLPTIEEFEKKRTMHVALC